MGRQRRQKNIVSTESFGQARGTSAYDQVSEPLPSARTPASRRRGRGEPHLVEYFMASRSQGRGLRQTRFRSRGLYCKNEHSFL